MKFWRRKKVNRRRKVSVSQKEEEKGKITTFCDARRLTFLPAKLSSASALKWCCPRGTLSEQLWQLHQAHLHSHCSHPSGLQLSLISPSRPLPIGLATRGNEMSANQMWNWRDLSSSSPPLSSLPPSDISLALQVALKCADIGHVYCNSNVHLKWVQKAGTGILCSRGQGWRHGCEHQVPTHGSG